MCDFSQWKLVMLEYCSYAVGDIYCHFKTFIIISRLAKIDFRPITESYEKLFGLPIHHWPITTKVVRLLWINTIPKNYFVTLEGVFDTSRHAKIDFRPITESYEKLIWPSDSPLADYDKSRKTTMDKYYPQRTILWHFKVYFGMSRHAKIDFWPITESYEKLFGLPIHHWPITTKVVRLLWINTIPKELFLWHLKVYLVSRDMLKLIFDPLRKVTKSYLAFRFTIGRLRQKS